jgi:hypothetical protein
VRILARRFLASYLSALAACVGALLLALAIVDMLVDFDAVVEGGAGALLALLARVPTRWLPEALPLASLAAAFLAVALPARRGEVLALRACGIHPARATAPIVAAALGVGASAAWLAGMPDRIAEQRDGTVLASGNGVPAWQHDAGRVLRIAGGRSRGGELLDLEIFELDAEFRLRRRLRAEAARAVAGRLELRGAGALRFDPDDPGAPPRAEPEPGWIPAPGAPPLARAEAAIPAAATALSIGLLAALAVALALGVRGGGSLAARALAALGVGALFRGAWQAVAFAAGPSAGAGLAAAIAPWSALAALAALAAALWVRAPR